MKQDESPEALEDRTWMAALDQVSGLLESVAAARANQLVRRRIAAMDLVPRGDWADGQPSARELMCALSVELELASRTGPGTYVGADQVLRRVCRELGVRGADGQPVLRRTRAQVEAAPNPAVPREGLGRERPLEEARAWPPSLPEKRAGQKRRKGWQPPEGVVPERIEPGSLSGGGRS